MQVGEKKKFLTAESGLHLNKPIRFKILGT